MPPKAQLSVVVIAKNEGHCITESLRSACDWADELLIIDDCSSDDTAEIAARYGRVITEKWDIEGKFRNWAYAQTRNRWVLSLDADEILTDELKKEISALLSAPSQDGICAYNIPLRNFIGKYWVRNGGWYPAYKVRLFLKDKFKYEEAEVHPRVFIDGCCGTLKGEIIHNSYRDIAELTASMNSQTTLEAKKWLRSGRNMPLWHAIWRATDRFFRKYVVKKAYRDGLYGFVIAFYDSLYQVISYLKYREMKNNSGSGL